MIWPFALFKREPPPAIPAPVLGMMLVLALIEEGELDDDLDDAPEQSFDKSETK